MREQRRRRQHCRRCFFHAGAQAKGMLRFDQKHKRGERDAPADITTAPAPTARQDRPQALSPLCRGFEVFFRIWSWTESWRCSVDEPGGHPKREPVGHRHRV